MLEVEGTRRTPKRLSASYHKRTARFANLANGLASVMAEINEMAEMGQCITTFEVAPLTEDDIVELLYSCGIVDNLARYAAIRDDAAKRAHQGTQAGN